ncbi:hypothetical protein V6N13_111049 [Hibiscus sabdariffa]|uniref:BHLH domain-containing protein n=1 Tax=Hibiscus sabdariffa TaxID=183260 RepID=A0ABR2TJ56_9ROSI
MARKGVGCSNKRRRVSQRGTGEVISDKLEALKSLIPCNVGNGSKEVVKVEQLFQETADYIITLKTQAFVLQKLIEFYDGFENEKHPPIVQEDLQY